MRVYSESFLEITHSAVDKFRTSRTGSASKVISLHQSDFETSRCSIKSTTRSRCASTDNQDIEFVGGISQRRELFLSGRNSGKRRWVRNLRFIVFNTGLRGDLDYADSGDGGNGAHGTYCRYTSAPSLSRDGSGRM